MAADDWSSLSCWSRSQHAAFEELCCQIFRNDREDIPKGSIFYRLGAPDAGAEAIWKCPDGAEIGLQAKFFAALGDSQWKQLDESVKTAIEKRPNLAVYQIATPINLSDSKSRSRKSMTDKWNEHEKKWQILAKSKNMSVAFKYISGSDILDKLATDKHAGRRYFWFNKEHMSSAWFKNMIQKSVKLADERYSPTMHVSLELENSFNCLTLNRQCFEVIGKLIDPFIEFVETMKSSYPILSKVLCEIIQEVRSINLINRRLLDLQKLEGAIKKALEDAQSHRSELEKQLEDKSENDKEKEELTKYRIFRLETLISALFRLSKFVSSKESKLLIKPNLLLVGPWGHGKTHMFCHIAEQRLKTGAPTILLLGQVFNAQEPWTQIAALLGLQTKNEDEFLGALEAAAEANGTRALLMIDALNESPDEEFWNNHLPGMLSALSRYPSVGLAVSIRDTYEEDIIPPTVAWKNDFVRLKHSGFSGVEEVSTQQFCSAYGIEPLLGPLEHEFSNPQFLKLLCKGLNNKRLTRIPDGYNGISSVFNLFVESVNHKLARKRQLDFPQKDALVQEAVSLLASAMADESKPYLDRKAASGLVNGLLPGRSHSISLYLGLIREGILSEENYSVGSQKKYIVRFSYQKFSDHLIANALIKGFATKKVLASALSKTGNLHKYISETSMRWVNVVEALAIQVPEIFKVELFELIPDNLRNSHLVIVSFLNSLLWRSSDTIFDSTLKFVNSEVLNSFYLDRFFDIVVQVTGKPENAFNANGLHSYLLKTSLADRDSSWSLFLHDQQSENGAVNRLINWAANKKPSEEINNEILLLYATTITWFFSTSNRSVRDRATKALVNLIEDKPLIWLDLINRFDECNDLYVIERLYAAGCGIVLRTWQTDSINKIGQWVYKNIFEKGKPISHVLVRNYARTIVQSAIEFSGMKLKARSKLNPPFNLKWDEKALSMAQIEKMCSSNEPGNGYDRIWFNLTEGDFGVDVINSRFPWSGKRLDGSSHKDLKAIYDDFMNGLTQKQRLAWQKYNKSLTSKSPSLQGLLNYIKVGEDELNEFEATLTKTQLKIFQGDVMRWTMNKKERYPFNIQIAKRWMFSRVVELGWSPNLFSSFDSNYHFSKFYRESDRAESIGQKYQWIAYHELIAHLMDNYELSDEDKDSLFDTRSDVGYRDIDPSCLLRKTAKSESGTENWWSNIDYDFGADKKLNVWAHDKNDLPDPVHLLEVTNPNDDSDWLMLTGSKEWRFSGKRSNVGRSPGETRKLAYYFDACLIKTSEISRFYKWAKNQDFFSTWLRHFPDFTDIYLGEYPWSPNFDFFNCPDHLRDGWTKYPNGLNAPAQILLATDRYLDESPSNDGSVENTISFRVPCKWLIEKMDLTWDRHSGFLNTRKQLVSYDPSVDEAGPSCLLFKRQAAEEFCKTHGYSVVWILTGEKIGWASLDRVTDQRLHTNGIYVFDGKKLYGHFEPIAISWAEYCNRKKK